MKLAARIAMAFMLVNIVVITHELGHFAAAEKFGFPVNVISLGFGPKVYSFTIRPGLEGRLGAIPLGGYVQFSDEAKKRMLSTSAWRGAVLFGAGVAVNWFSPILVLLMFSRRYRRLDCERKDFPYVCGRMPRGVFWSIPIVGDMAFFLWCLVRPLGGEGLREEWAWKYTDFARAVGYFNLLPILGLDGQGVYANLVAMLHIKSSTTLCLLLWGVMFAVLISRQTQRTMRSML